MNIFRRACSRKVMLASAIVLIISAALVWQLSKARCIQLVGEVTCRVETQAKLVALTFDDGPTPEGVGAVLAELEPRGIPPLFS